MINTEEEYNDRLNRLVIGAEYLENPFLSEAQKAKAQTRYDGLELEVRTYKEAQSNGRVKYLADPTAGSESRAS